MALGNIIQEYRKKHGMSMDDFAAVSGISKAYISVLERNQRPGTGKPVEPSFEIIEKLAAAMNIDARKLLLEVFENYKKPKNTYDIKAVFMSELDNEAFVCIITGTASADGKLELLNDIRTKIQGFAE